jgi:hypothetical protein
MEFEKVEFVMALLTIFLRYVFFPVHFLCQFVLFLLIHILMGRLDAFLDQSLKFEYSQAELDIFYFHIMLYL